MGHGHDPGDGRKLLGRAPRANAPRHDEAAAAPSEAPHPSEAQGIVDDLVRSFREQVRRALGVELDMTPTSLAFVDHHLTLAQAEEREAITTLVAAGAGAYYGELVREHVGATWIGAGDDPRRLRLLVTPQFMYFSPIDQAWQAIVCGDEARSPLGSPLDDAFHSYPTSARGGNGTDVLADDATWLEARLAELPPVPEDQFYTLTCRFETLQLMLELLAAKHAAEGRAPRELGVVDYLDVLRSAST
jgi:hypothetical protein